MNIISIFKNTIILSLTVLIFSLQGAARVALPQISSPPVIDGHIDGSEEWKKALSITNFVNVMNTDFAEQRTRVWLCHDNNNMYLAFKMYDSRLLHESNEQAMFKNKISGHGNKVWKDDCMEIRLLPPWAKDIKGFSHFYLAFNANGATLSQAPEGYDSEWALKCKVKATISEGYWMGEIKIPLSALTQNNKKINPSDYDKWRVNFIRIDTKNDEISSWEIISDQKHNTSKYMALMRLATKDIPVLKIPDIDNNIENLEVPYYSPTRFISSFWPYTWPFEIGRYSLLRHKKCKAPLLAFPKGEGTVSLKTPLPQKGKFFWDWNIVYRENGKIKMLYSSPAYIFSRDNLELNLKGEEIDSANFNGKNIPITSENTTKVFPRRGLNNLLVKSKTPNVSLSFLGSEIIPLEFTKTDNGYLTEFYSQTTDLKFMGKEPTAFSATVNNGQFFIWNIAKSGYEITNEKQYAALNLLLPESVKLIGASSKSDLPNGFPPISISTIAPRNDIYTVNNYGKIKLAGKTFVHYAISTDKLRKYQDESRSGLNSRLSCVIMLKPEKILPEGSKFYYYSVWGEKKVPELLNSTQISILPELKGKQPSDCRITMYMSQLNGIRNPNIMTEAYKTAKAAGCNEVFIANNPVNSLPFGLKKTCFFQMETYAWRWSTLEMRRVYKEFPKSRSDNDRYSKYASISFISRNPQTWPYLDEEFKNIREREPHLTSLFWDYEFKPFAHYADLSPYTLNIFAQNYEIKEKLDKKIIESKYMKQWSDFRCKELGKISSILKKIANKYDFEFSFYTGGASKINREKYSVDVQYLHADRLYIGGYWESENNKELANLSKKTKTPQSFSAHMCIGPGTGWQEAVLLRRIMLSRGGGLLLWYETGFDGMELHAIAEVTRLVTDYEEFFKQGQMDAFGLDKKQINYDTKNSTPKAIRESLIGDIKSKKIGLVVYELDDKFLALLINDTSHTQDITVKFNKANGAVKEYYSDKTYHANEQNNIQIKPFKVMAFIGKLR